MTKVEGKATPRISANETITELTQRCFATGVMCAVPVEASDGVIVGGAIVIRGEHEFGLVRALLQHHRKAPAQVEKLKS